MSTTTTCNEILIASECKKHSPICEWCETSCFENSFLWKCPRDLSCFRNSNDGEYFGKQPGTVSMTYLLFMLLVLFFLSFVYFWRTIQLLEQREKITTKQKLVCFSLVFFTLPVALFAIFLLVYTPNMVFFSVCDLRWDITSVRKEQVQDNHQLVHLQAEVHVSVYNPNYFDLDVENFYGSLYLKQTSDKENLALFNFLPPVLVEQDNEKAPSISEKQDDAQQERKRKDYIKIKSGHIIDVRIVVNVVSNVVIHDALQLIEEYAMAKLILDLNAATQIKLDLFHYFETPKIPLKFSAIQLDLNLVDRSQCKCLLEQQPSPAF